MEETPADPGWPQNDREFQVWEHGRRQGHREAAREIDRLRQTLREVRTSIIESAGDVVWMRGGIETMVDRITAALGDHATADEASSACA